LLTLPLLVLAEKDAVATIVSVSVSNINLPYITISVFQLESIAVILLVYSESKYQPLKA